MILSPRKANRHPWEMFFIGIFYASIAIFLVNWFFSGDIANREYSGWILVSFIVMFSLPFMYFLIRDEEERDVQEGGIFRILKEHRKAVFSLMWLFLGFVVALSFWYIALGPGHLFDAQIKTYCSINKPSNLEDCVNQFKSEGTRTVIGGKVTSTDRLLMIFANNIKVLIFTLVFSLIFGAGAIFILAWNASVIAAAIGIFSKSSLGNLPLGLARYMIHGVPEILAYFVAALGGGIISIAVIKKDMNREKFWNIMQDSINLVIVAVVILFLAALIEVFITPVLF